MVIGGFTLIKIEIRLSRRNYTEKKKIIGIVFYERIEENPAFPFRSDIT